MNRRSLLWAGWFLFNVLMYPLRFVQSIRSSMTAASVTLLLAVIATLNVFWGYPWTGLFSFCVTMFVGGLIINRLMRPNLHIHCYVPQSSPVGTPFDAVVQLSNRGSFPAIDLSVTFDASPRPRIFRNSVRQGQQKFKLCGTPISISVIDVDSRTQTSQTLVSHHRGMHPLPPVTSKFPFCLFQSTVRQFDSRSTLSRSHSHDDHGVPQFVPQIAITPKPLSTDETEPNQQLLQAVGSWSRRLSASDAMEYIGSREY